MVTYREALDVALHAADEAAVTVVQMQANAASSAKPDGSIVTEADLASQQLIIARLHSTLPNAAILTEEGLDDSSRLGSDLCWIVDPIDGTQNYSEGGDDYDIYIALTERGRVVVAVTVQPAFGLAVIAMEGGGAWVRRDGEWTRLTFAPARERPVVGTRPWLGAPANLRRLESAVSTLGGYVVVPPTGLGIRSFLNGGDSLDAAVGLFVGGTEPSGYEWDFAPIDLIMREAGGAATDLGGNQLHYNQPDPRPMAGLIFARDTTLARRLSEQLTA